MEALKKERPELQFVEDSGRGYRRVVPSPRPVTIVERDSILNLLDNEYIVIACGGGGIPVIKNENGDYTGVPAVIDKDFASAKLAELVDADYLFILTAVDHVAVNFGRPDQMQLTEMTVDQAREYCSQGQFAAGSMLPKVQAAMAFAESKKGRNAVIASLEKAPLAMVGKAGPGFIRVNNAADYLKTLQCQSYESISGSGLRKGYCHQSCPGANHGKSSAFERSARAFTARRFMLW